MNSAPVSQWVLDKFVMAFKGLARKQQLEIIEGFCLCACDDSVMMWDYNMRQNWPLNAWNYICVPCGIEDEFGSGTYKDELLKAVKEQFMYNQQPGKDDDEFRDLLIDMFNEVKEEMDQEAVDMMLDEQFGKCDACSVQLNEYDQPNTKCQDCV